MKVNVLKKILATSMTVALAVGLFAGCGQTAKKEENANNSQELSVEASKSESAESESTEEVEEKEPVELIMIMYQSDAAVNALEVVHERFHEKYPWITVKMEVVENSQWKEFSATRFATGELDLVITSPTLGLINGYPPYVLGKNEGDEGLRIKEGLLLDLAGQPFMEQYTEETLNMTAIKYGYTYGVPMGFAPVSGMFYNKAIFEQYDLEEPKTWDEFIAVCETLKTNGIAPITSGMKDSWPPAMAWQSVVQADYKDSGVEYIKGLWTGERALNDEQSMKSWKKLEKMAQYYEQGVETVDYSSCVSRFVTGKAAMMSDATWTAPTITLADPNFEFGYFGMPGDEAPADGGPVQLTGKYDHCFSAYAQSEHIEECLLWLEFISEPEIYEEYINAIGMLPCRSDVEMTDKFMRELMPKVLNPSIGFENLFYRPSGVGQYATFAALTNLSVFGGEFDTVEEIADLAQRDWKEAIDKVNAEYGK